MIFEAMCDRSGLHLKVVVGVFTDPNSAKLKGVLKLDWLSRASSPPSFDPVFLREWAQTIELKQDVFDSMSPFFVSQTQPESMETSEDGDNGGVGGENQG